MDILSLLKQSLLITIFVLSMMLIIEYLNVLTRGIWSKSLKSSPSKQILLAALLGLIPGCLGAYTAVSLYVHNIISTGALVAAMIATSGDEAFFMFSIIPETAIIIHMALFFIAVAAGFAVNMFYKNREPDQPQKHFHVHEEESDCICFDRKVLGSQLRNISFIRFFAALAIVITMVIIGFELLHHEHQETSLFSGLLYKNHGHPVWISITFLMVLGVSLFILLTVGEHFIKEHVLNHIIRKHFIRIFLWTFLTLLLILGLDQFIDLKSFIGENLYIVLLVAVLVGIIPESGPHFLFVVLFASGSLPFSILLANSIVQDGHASLPLLAETGKGFIKVKIINMLVGLVIGLAGLLVGI
jgi:hypothetical protein